MLRIFYIAFLFLFLPIFLFAKEIVLENSHTKEAYNGKIVKINLKKNIIKVKNEKNQTERIFKLDNNLIKQLKKGDNILVQPNYNHKRKMRCKYRNIRERIKKLVRKRRNILKTHKNISHHRMFRSGRK